MRKCLKAWEWMKWMKKKEVRIIIRPCGLGCVCVMLLCVPAQRREADLVADYHIAFWFSCYCDYITAYRGKSVVGHGKDKM